MRNVIAIAFSSLLLAASAMLFAADDKPKPKPKEAPKLEKDLQAIVDKLKDKSIKVRAQAIEDLAAKGEAAAPAAGYLVVAMMDKSELIALAALEAMEKVRKDLYKLLVALCIDKNVETQKMALASIGKLEKDGFPLLPILLSRFQKTMTDENVRHTHNPGHNGIRIGENEDSMSNSYFVAIRAIDPENPALLNALFYAAGPNNVGLSGRKVAITTLCEIAKADKDSMTQLMPILKTAFNTPELQLQSILYLGIFGSVSKEFLPSLKKLKLSENKAIRDAATKAVDQIEIDK